MWNCKQLATERVLPLWLGPPVSTPGVEYACPERIALTILQDPDRDLRPGRNLKVPGRPGAVITRALGTCFLRRHVAAELCVGQMRPRPLGQSHFADCKLVVFNFCPWGWYVSQ